MGMKKNPDIRVYTELVAVFTEADTLSPRRQASTTASKRTKVCIQGEAATLAA
jgi:hypothetical protein